LRTLVARTLVAAMLATAIAVCFTSGLVPVGFSILMTVLTAAMLFIARTAAPRVALWSGIGMWLTVTAVFSLARSATQEQVQSFVAAQLPQAIVLDYVLTPMPANPVCWAVMLPMLDGQHYRIRHGTWSLFPEMLPAANCPGRDLFRHVTAPVTAIDAATAPFVYWHGEVSMPRAEFAQLAGSSCEAAAFLRFARVPWTSQREHRWIIGDLRYDREPELGFAELELQEGAVSCPSGVPPWIAPRADLLR
jgi:inner membrane protein